MVQELLLALEVLFLFLILLLLLVVVAVDLLIMPVFLALLVEVVVDHLEELFPEELRIETQVITQHHLKEIMVAQDTILESLVLLLVEAEDPQLLDKMEMQLLQTLQVLGAVEQYHLFQDHL